MPKLQTGSVRKSGSGYAVRYRDESGKEKRASGFKTPTEAQQYVRSQVDLAARIRRGEFIPPEAKEAAPTFDALCVEYLDQHTASARTIKTIEERLKAPRSKFGHVQIDRLAISELRAYFAKLPVGYAPMQLRAFRQVLNYATECGYIASNPAKSVPMRRTKSKPREIFASVADVRNLSDKIEQRFAAIPIFGAATGLRPGELYALERSDVDRVNRTVSVTKSYGDGVLGDTKTHETRVVPLSNMAIEALDLPIPRLDTPLLFPAKGGGYINEDNFRNRVWRPALIEAGLDESLSPYAMRHSYCSWLLAAGAPVLDVAKYAGTSIRMIDSTYGHLVRGSDDRAREAIDALDSESRAAAK
jgi:integrase